MPPPHHHGHHGGGGHIPQSAFWPVWTEPSVQYVMVDTPVPDWVWIAGGGLAGIVLALLARGR